MSASNTISNLQLALNCAGKCDCCNQLQSEINAINTKIAGLKNVDENALRTSIRASLQPDITTAVGAGVALLAGKLDPQIKNLINGLTDAKQRIDSTENIARDAKAKADAQARQKYAQLSDLEKEVRLREYGDNLHQQGYSKAQVDAMLSDERLAASLREAKGQQALQAEYKNLIRAEQARATSAESTVGSKAANAIDEAARASSAALNANAEVTGLKGLVNGFKDQVGRFGRTIERLESAVGTAIANAAKAIGISEQALAATGRILGKIAEIFNIIGTFAVLFEQLATLNVLGGRIDAVENAVNALGTSVSGVLGKLLGLQNRIGHNEASILEVRAIAIDAKGIGEAANLKAGAAQVTASRAQGYATTAQNTAKQAQLTADGAVRNAKQANDNATTAYQKAEVAQSIAEQAKQIGKQALSKAGEAIGVALTAYALVQAVKNLKGLKGDPGIPGRQGERGLQGIPGRQGERGMQGVPGIPGKDGVTTVLPGTPGKQGERGLPGISGLPGRNGKDGKDGKDVNPGDLAGLKALIIQQHNQTRLNSTTQHTTTRARILTPIMAALAPIIVLLKQIFDIVSKFSDAAQLVLLNIINNKLGKQVTGGLSQFIETIAKNTYLEKALSVLTFAATIHNALMLSNNLGQTLITIVDQVTGFLLPKGIDGTPISFSDSLGKAVHLVIESTIGEENYKELSEDWQKINRIYQAASNVFNQVTQLGGLITTGLEVVGGNIGKIGNALRKGGVLLENAYGYMNPQPNLEGKFFSFMNTANEKLSSIAAVVAIPIAFKEVVGGIRSSTADLKREISQIDPKDEHGNPIKDKDGNIVHYKPGVEVPTPIVEEAKGEQAKADSTNFLELVLEDIFDGGD
ncbi:hypothetical protein [uncultured Nostoc sp.]|uniref:hypothetical protein n=1 Tax=uncultured Nostoc sp. TaxID=340711 RepID=UPI0035CAD404